MQKKRLLMLAARLDTVDQLYFDIETWHGNSTCQYVADHLESDEDCTQLVKEFVSFASCGTTACAVGHATLMPEFNSAGLGLRMNGWIATEPTFQGLSGFDAVEKFFGLSVMQAEKLFYYRWYPKFDRSNPREVARRIRELVETGRLASVSAEYAD